jgi:tetratricopeptide (TPR) repeat protein
MRRLAPLIAALLLPALEPIGSVALIGSGALLGAPVRAEAAEAVARVAQAITVRIEGATQGSGVLVKREGHRYTVLTAWHVVSGQRPGEELEIHTPDGQRHPLEQGSIRRIGAVDLAVLSFSSPASYPLARPGDAASAVMGSPIYVGGFALPSSAVPTRLLRFLKGDVIANARVAIPNGYQLLYSNPTLPGMSGGAVLNARGELVGIHGQGETDSRLSEQQGVAVKTGTNQAVPITYYMQYSAGAEVAAATVRAATLDDYLVQAKALMGQKGREQEMLNLADRVIAGRQSAEAYIIRAYAREGLADRQGAIADYSQALALNPREAFAYNQRGLAKARLGDLRAALADYDQAIAINPRYAIVYNNRGNVREDLGDLNGAIADFDQSIALDPRFAPAYNGRGATRYAMGDRLGAMADYNQALAVNPRYTNAYNNRGVARSAMGDPQGAIADYSQALAIDPLYGNAYFNRSVVWHQLGETGRMCDDLQAASRLGSDQAGKYYGQLCR